MRFFEDLTVGQRRNIGSFTFTAEDIKRFAAQFDPQPFHLDEEAGRNSLFGGLAASGWHVGLGVHEASGRRRPTSRGARARTRRGGRDRRTVAGIS